jgi:hypothetical protein
MHSVGASVVRDGRLLLRGHQIAAGFAAVTTFVERSRRGLRRASGRAEGGGRRASQRACGRSGGRRAGFAEREMRRAAERRVLRAERGQSTIQP